MKKQYLLIAVLSAISFLTGCKKELNPQQETADEIRARGVQHSAPPQNPGEAFMPHEILVKFKPGTSEGSRSKAFERILGSIKEHIITSAMKYYGDQDGIYLLKTPLQAIEAISRISGVEIQYAEPNYIYSHGDPVPNGETVPDEEIYHEGNLWGMLGDKTTPANQWGSQAGEAWAVGHQGSSGIYVGIIDEGVQVTHPDLDAQIWTNPFDPNNNVDDDGNGYADDVNGWDFAGGNNSVYDGGTAGSSDDHGTHVAGTIGAEANNPVPNHLHGVVGVNWKITLISAKFLGSGGGTTANAIKAVDYFTYLKILHKLNIVATNNSWGGGGFTQSLLDAITRGAKQNILFVAAAGNGNLVGVGQNNDKKANYPSNYSTLGQTGGPIGALNDGTKCNYDAVIAVAAINRDGNRAGFSNYGVKTVDLGAPGVTIWSSVAFSDYAGYSGTSMATPHVTGAAALYAASRPGVTALTIKNAILDAARATPTASLSGKTVTGGRLNVSDF